MNVDLLVTFVMRLLVATAEIHFLFLCSLPGFTTPVFSRFFFRPTLVASQMLVVLLQSW